MGNQVPMLAVAYEVGEDKGAPLDTVRDSLRDQEFVWEDRPLVIMFPADQMEEYMPLLRLLAGSRPFHVREHRADD